MLKNAKPPTISTLDSLCNTLNGSAHNTEVVGVNHRNCRRYLRSIRIATGMIAQGELRRTGE